MVEDVTTIGGRDYEIPQNGYIKVLFSAGETRASFDVNIIDDNQMEDNEAFRIAIFELSVPYGIILGSPTSAEFTILDDDSTTLSFSMPTFNVNENEGPAQPELSLSIPALFDINVLIDATNVDLSKKCDNFQSGQLEVVFPKGASRFSFAINITDDDLYEGNESISLVINNRLPDRVNLGQPRRATIVIINDEEPIKARFDKIVYTVQEHDGIIAPKITLSRPSPCCFVLRAKLNNGTACGRSIDCGYLTQKIYNYTFHAGSTCSFPDINITITDDMDYDDNETVEISIIEAALPFGVEIDEDFGGIATILINDNENAVSCDRRYYEFREDELRIFVKFILEKPATSNLTIKVNSIDDSAKGGVDYTSGPYYVFFSKGEDAKFLFIPLINDNFYEGYENFNITIDSSLPEGIVRVTPYNATIKIEDDEYAVCFEECDYTVKEGEQVNLDLHLSRKLIQDLTISLKYDDKEASFGSDYTAPVFTKITSETTETSFTITARNDGLFEVQMESFNVSINYPLKSRNLAGCCDKANVTIVDSDDVTIRFSKAEYRDSKYISARPRLVLNKRPPFSFRVFIIEEDGTAHDTLDYRKQHYRNKNGVAFEKNGNLYFDLAIERLQDELVEGDEFYYLRIETDALHKRVTAIDPSFTKVIIVDNDVTTVTRSRNTVFFSYAMGRPLNMTAIYYDGYPPETKTLLPGSQQITFSSAGNLRRVTIILNCYLSRNDFIIRSTRLLISSPPSHC